MLLQITQAGIDKELEALSAGTAFPAIDKIAFGSGDPVNAITVTALTTTFHESDIISVDRISDTAMRLRGLIPPDVQGQIREIGLLLTDGTLYAYGAYQPEVGGLTKGIGFSFDFYAILSKENISELTFSYTPIDVQQIADAVYNEALERLNGEHPGLWLRTITHLSGLNAQALHQQDMQNTTNQKLKQMGAS